MIVLGLTGSYGSGKSTVARFFEELGAQVIDADRLARAVVEPGQEAYEQILEEFGPKALLPTGELDREWIGKEVFADTGKRRILEGIVHPVVRKMELKQLENARKAGVRLVVLDVPLLFETHLDEQCDATCVVVVDEGQRLQRMAARGISHEEVKGRLEAQMTQEEKASRSNFVINNNGTMEETRRQVAEVFNTLISHAGVQSLPKE